MKFIPMLLNVKKGCKCHLNDMLLNSLSLRKFSFARASPGSSASNEKQEIQISVLIAVVCLLCGWIISAGPYLRQQQCVYGLLNSVEFKCIFKWHYVLKTFF